MRKITEQVVGAFQTGQPRKIGNTRTNGITLFLHDNEIAEHRADGIWITNAGWNSPTTKERLNGITGVHIVQKKGEWYLNGHRWDGEWICLNDLTLLTVQEVAFDMTSVWQDTYSKPIYSVFHTHVEAEVEHIEQLLKVMDIPTRRMYSDTQGKYLPNHFLIVPIAEFDRAKTFMNKVSLEALTGQN
jgi:hypothetical protein